mgnify:CR=1 FL=1
MKVKMIRLSDLEGEDQAMIRDTVEDFFIWLDRKRKAVAKAMKKGKGKKKKEVAQPPIQ